MSLLESLASAVFGSGDKKQMLAGLAAQLLSGQSSAPGAPSNGLSGLIQQFQQAGLGDLVNSWVGTGQNQPASADQIRQALGADTIQHFSNETGLQGAQVSDLLSQFLPQMIDKVTPNGQVPSSNNDLQGMLSGLLGSLGK